MYKIIICDDEKSCIEKMEQSVKVFFADEEIRIILFSDGEALLRSDAAIMGADILIMDIRLGGMDGLECSKRVIELNPYIQVIFVTNYMDYVENSYDIPHLWYLNKAKQSEFIGKALGKAKSVIDEQKSQSIIATLNGVSTAIPCRDILYFEQRGRKTFIVTKTGTFEEYSNIDHFENMVANSAFVRCHKSFLVNMHEVRMVGRQELEMLCGQVVPVSRSFRQNVQSFMLLETAEK